MGNETYRKGDVDLSSEGTCRLHKLTARNVQSHLHIRYIPSRGHPPERCPAVCWHVLGNEPLTGRPAPKSLPFTCTARRARFCLNNVFHPNILGIRGNYPLIVDGFLGVDARPVSIIVRGVFSCRFRSFPSDQNWTVCVSGTCRADGTEQQSLEPAITA